MSIRKQLITYSALFLAIVLAFSLLPNKTDASQSAQQKLESQLALEAIVGNINDLHLSEFVGVKIDVTEVSVDLWISSEPSKELSSYLQEFDVRGKDMPFIRLHRAPYSLALLTEARDKLSALIEKSLIEGGVVLSSANIRADGEGLDLSIDISSTTPDSLWISNLEDYLGVPVFVNPNKTDIKLLPFQINRS